ncbi:TrmH family RNA methyltransferase [Actinomarinicola tropica]|uniref:TrmH family RNA methyltransferase n=1 Tax=Actinomarinicola tropica TaxID=2789776 RepID=UPI00189A8649|nr:RNA methyltransferase [Actinomarinicola tropica]
MAPLAASNPRIRRLRRLSGRRSARSAEGAYLLEGPVLVAEALAALVPLDGIYAEPSALDPDLVQVAHAQSIPVHEVADGVLAGVTDTVTPRPILAVAPLVRTPAADVVDRAVAAHRPLLVLVDVRDPGNLGTLLRAAEASGVAGVLAAKGTVDPWSPKAVRSSAGAVLHVPVADGDDVGALLALLGDAGVRRLATVVEAGRPSEDADLAGTVALVLGGEAHGLPADVVAACDDRITIPMEGRAESLNVAMAGAVLAFEALRQRRAAGPGPSDRPASTDWTPGPSDDKVSGP